VPGRPGKLPQSWGASPPPFWRVSRLPGAAQTPKIDDFRSGKEPYIESPGVLGSAWPGSEERAQGTLEAVSPDLRGLDLEPSRRRLGWLREGSLAGVFGCHEMALELVSGADFWCKLMSRASPAARVWRSPRPEKRSPGGVLGWACGAAMSLPRGYGGVPAPGYGGVPARVRMLGKV